MTTVLEIEEKAPMFKQELKALLEKYSATISCDTHYETMSVNFKASAPYKFEVCYELGGNCVIAGDALFGPGGE